ncbi:DNA-binding LacI/PurR family transcriptional regulator [Actinomadura pelletieri DSM 43383]|uniref:DNA-binding LacI/PurR family transcriptional regulator n=1 Tax=Actinomadura pelletieri DSM 43383 TaxID=1120940 RepID=A0A495QIW5_9ACTN|nr:LacI family DNA-binding transcriptional regulator [Actinomadura pelletieri]RKS72110.1 DNA-binding LacI/PurR family transcriptional regulator [Actinomadura pelletieri DSM 43383]
MPAISRPTSKDVAQEAGVSQSTVSLVLGGKWTGRVSPATARSVRIAAERLGYRPNKAARNLRLGTTRTVLLMVPTLTAPFFGPVYTGAARVAARHGFGVVVSTWPEDDPSATAETADSVTPDSVTPDGVTPDGVTPDSVTADSVTPGGVTADGVTDRTPRNGPWTAPHEAIDGILASSMAASTTATTVGGALREYRLTPAVMLDSGPAGDHVPTVDFGVADGMRAIVEHLGALGHRRIGHVAAAVDQWTFRARADALTAAVTALPGGTVTRATCAIDVTSAKNAAGRLLDRSERPTALVCDDDLIAAGAYKAARARGLDVPSDLSVTGFDDVLLATALEPELTTIRLPAEELGAQGMTALLDLLAGRRPPPRTLPGELIVRGSTAPPTPGDKDSRTP